jgi:hypothetical protein
VAFHEMCWAERHREGWRRRRIDQQLSVGVDR